MSNLLKALIFIERNNAHLSGYSGCQFAKYRYIWQQVIWKTMPLLQIFWTVVGNPDFLCGIFPDQHLEWKVNGSAGRG
jgi:hypothetical protein